VPARRLLHKDLTPHAHFRSSHRVSANSCSSFTLISKLSDFAGACLARPIASRPNSAIVNCSSIGGVRGDRGIPSYTASRHGVIGLTRAAALEYAAKGVGVNSVCPGRIDTAFARAAFEDEKEFEALSKSLPVG